MKQEEMNTQLYEKLAAEQTKYRDWLMGQPPEEILNHAYEYAVREDILAAAELMDIPQAQAAALLAVPTEAALLRPDPSPWLDRRCWSYISDGPYHKFNVGKLELEFKHRSNREISGLSYKSAMVIQALRALGKENVDDTTIKKLQRLLTDHEKQALLQEAQQAVAWIYNLIKKICRED